MDVYKASITFLNNKEKDSEKLIQYYHRARDPIAIGSSPENNVRITNAEPIHCRIYVNPSQKITIENLSDANPIHVNNEAVKDKTLLSSGDIITVMNKRMRWETYADLKRRTAHLSKNVRKELKHKYVKTDKRVTIHNFTSLVASEVEETPKDSIEEEKVSDLTESKSEVGVQLQPLAPQKEAIAESEETTADQTSPPSPNKENLKTPAKNVINLLNVSGVLQTSYTPSARARTRSVSKTPYNTPERSPAVKNILKESPSVSNPKTPASAKRSMYLIDLVTPQVQKNSTSTPRSSVSTHNKTPRTLGKTPLRKEALLKSAIKNSAVKNNVSTQPATPSKQKALFASASPAFDSSASIIEVSMSSSTEEIDASGTPVKESSVDGGNGGESETVVISSQSSDEDVKNLLDSINNVLEEKPSQDATDNARNISMLTEKDETQVIEKNFNKILDGNNESVTESIFGDEPASNTIVEKFEELVTGKGNNSTEKIADVQKKGEDLLNLIANVKEAIQTEPNNTTQILSARYSNITPNDSFVDTSGLNASKNYDARTPKLSILGTITSLRKSDAENKLAKSPVSRLSITHNSTEVVENYQLNTDIPKSLRSTRKRIGSAMSSVLNTSTCADTTIDPNESLNVSVQQEVNQSQTETTNILSLDDQPVNKSDVAEAEISNNFIQFAGHDEDNNQTEIFEITSEHSGSNKDENEEPASDSESSSEEEQEEEDDEIYSSEEESNQSENKSCMKFRLSGLDDLVEEGIKPLDTSMTEDASPVGEDDEMNVDENNEAIDTEEVPQPANESLIEENISSSDCISSQEIPSSQEECVSVVEGQSAEEVKTEQESICPDSAIVSDDINETTGEDVTEKKEADETIQLVDESMNDISGENSAAHIEIPETQQFDFNTEEEVKKEEEESTVLSDDDQQEEKVTCIEIEEEVSVKGKFSAENVEAVEETPSEEVTKDRDDVQEENGLVNASVQSLNSTSNDFEKDTSGGDIEIPETQQFELNEEVSLDKEMEALEETQNEDATHNESSLYQVEEEVTPPLSKTQEATDNAQTEEQVDNSSEIVCQESASSQTLGNETSSEMEEEHLRSSFLATIENEVEEKVEENSTAGEQPPAEVVEDETPINKSEYVDEEYLETSALESFSKQKPRESELFSETEFSRVEVSFFIDKLKSDADSPKEVAVDDDVTSEKIEEDAAADEPPTEVNAVESNIDEDILEEVSANDTNALESTESPPEGTKEEEEVQQVVENQETKEQTIEEKLDLMMGEDSEPKPTETTLKTVEEPMEDNESNKLEPVEEEPCVKKYAYVTTDDTTPLAVIETPSKRRTARINYSELASGSPARSRKARSMSVESNKQEEKEKPSSSKNSKMEPITENNETKEEVTVESVTLVDDETVEDKAPSETEDKQEEPIEADAQVASDDNCILIESSEDDEAKSSKALPDEKDDQQLVTEVENENTDEIIERETASDTIQIDDDSEGNDEPSKDEATDNVESLSEVAIDTPTASIGSEHIGQKEPQDVGDDIHSVEESTKEEEPIKEELTQPPSSEVENDSTEPENQVQNDQVEEISEKEKSVEKETTAKPTTFETPSKRRAARVNYTELATGSPAKLRKARSTSIDTNKDEKVPANNPKMATIVEDDVTLKISAELADKPVEKEAEPAEEHSTVEVAEAKTKARRKREVVMQESVATPTRRARRGVTPSVVHQEPETKPAESQSAVSEEPIIKKGRGGRKAKVVEDVEPNNQEEPSASQVKAEQLEEHAEVAEKIPSPPPAKKGRGRKHKIEEEPQTEEVKTETAETSPKRSRRGISKDVEIIDQKQKEPPKRGRGIKVKEPEVESEQNAVSDSQKDAEAEKPIAKRGRGKKTKETEVEDDKATADPEPKTEVEQPPGKRGRGKKVVVEPATEVDVPSELTVDLTEEKPVAKRGRGKKANEPEPDAAEKELKEEIEKPTAKRGRGRKVEEPPPETSSKAEEIEKPAARRGRGKKLAEPEVQPKEDEAVVEAEKIAEVEKPVAVKRGRGKRAAAPESEIEQKPDASEKVVEIEKPAPKRGRGKNVKETQVETAANEAVATTSQDASPKRARAARGVSKDVESKSIEEQPPPKRARGRKAAVIAEQPEEEDTPIEAVETKKGRGRKAQVGKKEAKEQTPESSPQVRRDKTPVARATKKQVTIVTPSQMEKRSVKEKTTSPKLAVIEEEPKAKRRPKRAATKVTDEVPTAKRPTRGRK